MPVVSCEAGVEQAVRFDLIAVAAPPAAEANTFAGGSGASPGSLQRLRAAAGRLARGAEAVRSPAAVAAATAGALGREAAAVDDALRDRAHGLWADRALADVATAEPAALERWLNDPTVAPPEGESVCDLVARAAAWLDRAGEPNRPLIAITHPGIVRACLVAALSCPAEVWFKLDVAYGSRSILTRSGSRWRVGRVNGPL